MTSFCCLSVYFTFSFFLFELYIIPLFYLLNTLKKCIEMMSRHSWWTKTYLHIFCRPNRALLHAWLCCSCCSRFWRLWWHHRISVSSNEEQRSPTLIDLMVVCILSACVEVGVSFNQITMGWVPSKPAYDSWDVSVSVRKTVNADVLLCAHLARELISYLNFKGSSSFIFLNKNILNIRHELRGT